MLDTNAKMPNLLSNPDVVPLTDNAQLLSTGRVKQWHQAPQHLVYFFAPWCTVCALSQPSLTAFSKMRPDTQIIMVALDWENQQAVIDFRDSHQFNLPIVLGNNTMQRKWQIDAYPSYYFVDNQGRILSKDRGVVTLPGLLARSLY